MIFQIISINHNDTCTKLLCSKHDTIHCLKIRKLCTIQKRVFSLYANSEGPDQSIYLFTLIRPVSVL